MRHTVQLVVLLALATACGRGTPADPETLQLGRKVYGEEGCAACHGADRRGAAMGPPLERLSRHWDEPSLERFLLAPDEVIAASARLRRLDGRYPADMPAVFTRDDERVRALVAFLLDE